MPTVQEYESQFNGYLETLRNLGEHEYENDSFYIRDILLYSWLIHERDGIIRKRELAKYISPSGEAAIDAIMFADFQPRRIACVEGDNYRFSTEALEAIPRAFNNPQHGYQLSEPVPYWDNITGKQLVEYFCGIASPRIELVQLANNAFRNMLQGFQSVQNNNLLRFTRGKNIFYVYVCTTDGALRRQDADYIGAELFQLNATDAPVLVCISKTDNNEVNRRLRDFPNAYGVWSIELVSLFHRMDALIKEFDQQRVSQHFLKVFPSEVRSFFSARHAAQRVRDGL